MRRTSKASLLLHIVLLLLCSILFLFAHSTNGDIIDQTCKQTPFPDLCSSILHSKQLPPNTDLKGIAFAMVNGVLENATGTLNYIQGLVNQTKDPQLQRKLAICAEIYIPIVNQILPQAANSISQGQFGLATYSMVYSKKDVGTCDKAFSGSGGSPLGNRNSIMQNLLDVAAAILKLLLNKGFVLF